MALKKRLTEEETIGLSQEEIKIATKLLRKQKTAAAIPKIEALKVYEMYMVGCSFDDISTQFPQYTLPQIILTAALNKWGLDREGMQSSLRDRVKAKVVKSILEQVDFLTTMLTVHNVKHLTKMRAFATDPLNNPAPEIGINSIKEYKEITETLYKIIQGTTTANSKSSAPFDALMSPSTNVKKIESKRKNTKDDDDDVIDMDTIINGNGISSDE